MFCDKCYQLTFDDGETIFQRSAVANYFDRGRTQHGYNPNYDSEGFIYIVIFLSVISLFENMTTLSY